MSAFSTQLHWQRSETALVTGKYSNAHTVQYGDRHDLPVDTAPDWGGDPANTNPEQALAAAPSSRHMMTPFAIAAKAVWPVASYHDHAVGHLGKNPKGQMSVSQIDLHPVVRFDAAFAVYDARMQR